MGSKESPGCGSVFLHPLFPYGSRQAASSEPTRGDERNYFCALAEHMTGSCE